jgi:protein-tyrosine phosphatase
VRRTAPQRAGAGAASQQYVRANDSGWWRLRDNRVVVVCTANLIRSPMTAALLGRALEEQRVEAEIRSCGVAVHRSGPMSSAAADALARRGIDTAHVSRPLDPRLVGGADLVLTMTRAHLREVVAAEPDAFPRTFTLKELVRRARVGGPRRPGESMAQWLARLAPDRTPMQLMGSDDDDDIADPVGGPDAAFERCAAELESLVRLLVPLAWPMITVALNGSPVTVERYEPSGSAPLLPPMREVVSPLFGDSLPAPTGAPLPPPIVVHAPPAPAAPAPAPAPAPDRFEIGDDALARAMRRIVASGDVFDVHPDGPMAAGVPREGTDWPATRQQRWAADRLGGATVWLLGRSPQLVAQWTHAVANGIRRCGRASFAATAGTVPGDVGPVAAVLLLAEAGLVAVTSGGRDELAEARVRHAAAGLPLIVVLLDDEPDPVRAVLDVLGLHR